MSRTHNTPQCGQAPIWTADTARPARQHDACMRDSLRTPPVRQPRSVSRGHGSPGTATPTHDPLGHHMTSQATQHLDEPALVLLTTIAQTHARTQQSDSPYEPRHVPCRGQTRWPPGQGSTVDQATRSCHLCPHSTCGGRTQTQYDPGPGVVETWPWPLLFTVHLSAVPKPQDGIDEYFESGWRPVDSGSA